MALGGPPSPVGYFDVAGLFDRTFHLSVPGLEYPRRDLPDSVVFTGPLPPARPDLACGAWTPPPGDAPLVHVTQGTFANADPTALLVPTLRGPGRRAGPGRRHDRRPTGAGRARPLDGGLPANAQLTELVPYADLLPLTSVVVTNGGWGGVQQALAHGVPVVVAGASEEKPEVAARVAWSGAGLDLHTGRPSPRRIRHAVRTTLRKPRHRDAAARLRAEFTAMPDPVDVVAAAVVASARAPAVRTS